MKQRVTFLTERGDIVMELSDQFSMDDVFTIEGWVRRALNARGIKLMQPQKGGGA